MELERVLEMSSAEFTLWQMFFACEPWGSEVENWRMGVIASTLVNCTPRGKNPKEMKPTDFYANPYEQPADTLTAEQREFLDKRKKQSGHKRRHRNN